MSHANLPRTSHHFFLLLYTPVISIPWVGKPCLKWLSSLGTPNDSWLTQLQLHVSLLRLLNFSASHLQHYMGIDAAETKRGTASFQRNRRITMIWPGQSIRIASCTIMSLTCRCHVMFRVPSTNSNEWSNAKGQWLVCYGQLVQDRTRILQSSKMTLHGLYLQKFQLGTCWTTGYLPFPLGSATVGKIHHRRAWTSTRFTLCKYVQMRMVWVKCHLSPEVNRMVPPMCGLRPSDVDWAATNCTGFDKSTKLKLSESWARRPKS